MSNDTPEPTETSDVSSAASLAALVRRRQNLQILATLAALVALVLLLNLTPVPGWVCSFIELEPDVPADLLGEAYWDDCFGGPLGDFAAGSLPRPEHLSYAPEAGQLPAKLETSPPKKTGRRAPRTVLRQKVPVNAVLFSVQNIMFQSQASLKVKTNLGAPFFLDLLWIVWKVEHSVF